MKKKVLCLFAFWLVLFTSAQVLAQTELRMVPVSPLTDFSFDFQDLLFTPVPEKTGSHK